MDRRAADPRITAIEDKLELNTQICAALRQDVNEMKPTVNEVHDILLSAKAFFNLVDRLAKLAKPIAILVISIGAIYTFSVAKIQELWAKLLG